MFGNISQLLEMKKKAEELKAKLDTITITEKTDGITVDCNGNKKILAIHISPELMADKHQLEEKIAQAVNQAIASAERAAMGDMAALAGGMQGLSGLFGK